MSSSTKTAPRPAITGYAYAIAVVLIWSGFSLTGRHAALAGGVRLTPWDLGALRHLVASVAAVILWLAGYGAGLTLRRGLMLGTISALLFPLPSYLGFTDAPAAHGAVILSGTQPFLVAIGTWALYGQRWSRMMLLSLLVLLAGISLLGFEAYVQGARPGAWRGDLWFTVAAVAWAAYTIAARNWQTTPGQAIIAAGLCGACYLPVWALLLPSNLGAAPAGEIAFQLAFQGGFAVLLSLLAFTRALALLGPIRLTTITALVPGLAGVLAAPLLGETIGVPALAGLVLVCCAVALGVHGDRR